MSKYVDWSEYYGEGDIVCNCEQCDKEERIEFENNSPDYKEAQKVLNELGWISCMINGKWYDFCCEDCRNEYIKNNL